MGLKDMKPSNQTTNDSAVDLVAKAAADAAKNGGEETTFEGGAISSALWSSDGLVSTSRLFQRSSSTPPTHVDAMRGAMDAKQKTATAYDLSALSLRETTDENNQDDDDEEFGRHDLVMPLGKHIQRSWSAPPVPENFDAFFPKKSSSRESQRTSLFGLGGGNLPGIDEAHRVPWSESSEKSLEKTSVATVSPLGSPLTDEPADATSVRDRSDLATSFQAGSFYSAETRRSSKGAFMTLVDRVQEDFPRTPSPVFGAPPSSTDQMMAGAMSQLHVENSRPAFRQPQRRHERSFPASVLQTRGQDVRPPHRPYQPLGFVPTYPVVAPPGFQPPSARGIYGSPMMGDPRTSWSRADEAPGLNGRFQFAPSDYGGSHHTRPTFKADLYPTKQTGGIYGHVDAPRIFPSQGAPVCPTPMSYEIQGHPFYGASPSGQTFRAKLGFSRRHDYAMHPAHMYNSTTLLEEFKSGAKSDKWDLRTIQGHLAIFARDQTGSRFIQQKLEKADDAARQDAFDEVYPDAMDLMTDVFGNYVIQKFFDHGSIEQQRRLVNLMKDNMVELALQVYGCRVIQKALEVTQVDEQLLLIRELRGHVLRCVVDQNGNHVLQKCIEAASLKKNVPGFTRQVTGEDIQFIIDDFVGQAAVLSTHAYGCRVIQRVLEHCSANQIRPIVNEIMYECRELVKDQFGNYVVQHVIVHGEVDQRNVVMEAILPDVAKWSQHKYASNVVEACLDNASKKEISQIVNLILDCDESGSSCALLPMMKHMYGNYVVQKLLDRADRQDRQRIVRIIQHNAEYLRRFTYGKHVLSRLEREMHTGHMY